MPIPPVAAPTIESEIDPFDTAIPGQSLTQEPGAMTWERPAEFSDPSQAAKYVRHSLNDPKSRERTTALLEAGVAVEAIAKVITFAGFSEGKWSPDVAELIQPLVALYILEDGREAGISDIQMYITDPDKKKKEEYRGVASLMKKIKPEKFEKFAAKGGAPEVEEEVEETVVPMTGMLGGLE